MRFKVFISGLLIALAASLAGASVAQDKPPQAESPASPEVQINPEVKRVAQELIEKALHDSHAAEIFTDLRRTLSDVYIPVMRELVQGGYPGAPEADAATATALAKMLTLMDYARKAGDELDVALSENRSAMISDAATQIARNANKSEIADLKRMLDLRAVRKTLDAFYSTSKLVTGFSYEDSRTFSEFSAWANTLNLDLSQAMPGTPGSPKAVPSNKKVVKAQAFIQDFLRLSHLDEMAADAERFAREVYAETVPLSGEERDQLQAKISQFEFMYNMQKAVVIGVAPSVLAAALTDEQLETFHRFLRTPAFARAFDLLRDTVKTATAYTKEDILEAQKAVDDLDKKAKLRERSAEEQNKAKEDWQALIDKWTEILKNRISPETRRGLDQSLDDMQQRDPPI